MTNFMTKEGRTWVTEFEFSERLFQVSRVHLLEG